MGLSDYFTLVKVRSASFVSCSSGKALRNAWCLVSATDVAYRIVSLPQTPYAPTVYLSLPHPWTPGNLRCFYCLYNFAFPKYHISDLLPSRCNMHFRGNSFMSFHYTGSLFLLTLNNIPMCGNTTFFLFTYWRTSCSPPSFGNYR